MSETKGAQLRIIGFESVDAYLRDLNTVEQAKAVRKGLRAGGSYLRKGGRKRLRSAMKSPKGVTGNMLKAFAVKVKKGNRGVVAGFVPFKGVKDKKREAIKIYSADGGTQPRRWRNGKSTGVMPSLRHYWTRTKEEDSGDAFVKIEEGIKKAAMDIYNKRK